MAKTHHFKHPAMVLNLLEPFTCQWNLCSFNWITKQWYEKCTYFQFNVDCSILFKIRSWRDDLFYLKDNFNYVISMACWNDTLNLEFFAKKFNGLNLNRIVLLSPLVFLNTGL